MVHFACLAGIHQQQEERYMEGSKASLINKATMSQ